MPRNLVGVPRVPPQLVARERLVRRLEEGTPLCVLRSAGGTGKTTLLAQWVAGMKDTDVAAVWITLDAQTQSRAGFWVRVLTHLHRAGLLDDATLYRELATVADSADLVRGALERVLSATRPVVLVLDDFAASGDFWDDVCLDLVALLQRVSTLRCIVAGRFQTLLEGPTARATIGTQILDTDEMALTDDEIRSIVETSGPSIDAPTLASLVANRSYRSAMELRYALDLLQRSSASRRPTAEGMPGQSDVASTLAAGIRNDLAARVADTRLLDLLGALALAPYTDVALADALADTPAEPGAIAGADLLAALEHAGVGYWSELPDGCPAFRLSDHVRAVAAAQFADAHPSHVPNVLATVARWLVRHHNDPSHAIEYALRAGDLDYADQLLVRAFPLAREDSARIARKLGALPAAQVREHPYLAMFYGLALNARATTRARAVEFLAAAALISHRRTASTPHAERVVTYGLETAAWRFLGQRTRMLDTARRALRELAAVREGDDGARSDRSLDVATALAVSQAATSLFFGDDLAGARDAYDALSALAAERNWAHYSNVAACGRAMTHILDGRYTAARTELASVRADAWPESWIDAYQGAFRNIAQAWVHIDDGCPRAALMELEPLVPHLDTIEHWEFLAGASAVAQAMCGHADEAERWLDQLRRDRLQESTLPSVKGRLGAMRSILRLATGAAREDSRQRLRGRARAADSALRAIIAAARGADQEAVALLAQGQATTGTPLQEALVAVAGATVAQRTRSGLSASLFGTTLATLMVHQGLHWPVSLLSEDDRVLLLAALERDVAEETHLTVAAACAAVPPIIDQRLWQGVQVPALTPRELEILHVLAATASRAEIASRLYVSINTIKAQLRTLYTKLGVRAREDALTRAVALGLLVEDEPRPEAPPTSDRL